MHGRVVREVQVLERQVMALRRVHPEEHGEQRQHDVVGGERAEGATQPEAPHVDESGGLHRAEQDRPDEKAAQDEEEIHPEEDRHRRGRPRAIHPELGLVREDRRDVVLDDAEDRDDAHAVQLREAVVEQIQRKQAAQARRERGHQRTREYVTGRGER